MENKKRKLQHHKNIATGLFVLMLVIYIVMVIAHKKAPELTDYSGLHLVDFYFLPHYLNFPYKEATQKIVNEYSQKIDLRPISNNQVITVLGDEIKTLEKPKKGTKK